MAIYSRLHVALFGGGEEPATHPQQRLHYERNCSRVILAYAGPEFVIYALYRPDTERVAALDASSRLATWLRSRQADLFIPM